MTKNVRHVSYLMRNETADACLTENVRDVTCQKRQLHIQWNRQRSGMRVAFRKYQIYT